MTFRVFPSDHCWFFGANFSGQSFSKGIPKIVTSSHFAPKNPLIVHSHLHWDWVWQRPQQFLSRLSRNRRVLFCEGPRLFSEDKPPFFQIATDARFPNVQILQTHLPASRFGDGAWVDSQRLKIARQALNGPLRGQFYNPVQWFYDPMAVSAFVGQLDEKAVVYDCMDELSKFRFAPPELIERERILLDKADVVFAGGRKMWEAKSRRNSNCHFYGCGVDIDHFGKARKLKTELPKDLAAIPGPRLGYFGVVDERLDYDLIAQLADEDLNRHIVMVGPFAKIDPEQLPRRANLHWLGGRDYADLPAYCKGFDACLMPFALNEATAYINPTKTLEYMATGKPIVSTAVSDVVSNFSSVVHIARNGDEFLALCRAALAIPHQASLQRGLQMAQDNTWDSIVAKLDKHLDEAVEKRARKNVVPVLNGAFSHCAGETLVAA